MEGPLPVLAPPNRRPIHPISAGLRAILTAHGVNFGKRTPGTDGPGRPTVASVARAAGVADDCVRAYAGDRRTPMALVLFDSVLGVFGFELAIRRIPEDRRRHRIDPVVGPDANEK